jgi:drug/metabolite transporter (DMT)-like permease
MRGYVALLLLLAAIWGASFMFIKIAVEELEPTTTMFLRLAFSALPLLALVVYKLGVRPAWDQLRAITKAAVILGIVNTALPFTLIAWGETRIDSGVAAIANATVPIFVTILAFFFRKSESATGARLFGILLGLAGVAVLTGVHPEGGWAGAIGTLAVIDDVRNDVLAAGSIIWGAVWAAPLGIAQAPGHLPSWGVIASILALALGGTVAGQLIYFRMIYQYGSARASLVVYLLPVTALFYGAFLLGETITVSALVGLALILTGTALGSGVLRMPRRTAVPAAP